MTEVIIGAIIIVYLAWAVYDLQKQVSWLHNQNLRQHEMNRTQGEFMKLIIAAIEEAQNVAARSDEAESQDNS